MAIGHLFRTDVLRLEGAQLNQSIAHHVGSIDVADFSRDVASVAALPLPPSTDCCEDWIHTELGPRGRWIVRLLRYYRAEPSHPWKSKELYVADSDEESVPLATAYGRAWLLSRTTWPSTQSTPDYRLAS